MDGGARRRGWRRAGAILLGAGLVVLLVDAVRDLEDAGLFAGLLRLVVEAVAAVVTVTWVWGRRRHAPASDERRRPDP